MNLIQEIFSLFKRKKILPVSKVSKFDYVPIAVTKVPDKFNVSGTGVNPNMEIKLIKATDLATGISDLSDLTFCGTDIVCQTLQDGDTLVYSTTTNSWVPSAPGTISPKEVIFVNAELDATLPIYNGNALPPLTSYSEEVIYKIQFVDTNSVPSVELSIDGLNSFIIQTGTTNGFQDLPEDFITPGVDYFLTWDGGRFQLTTSNPGNGNPSEFINPLPTTQTLGGITVGSTFPIKQDGTGYTMQEMWDQLLYPYQLPALSNLSITGVANTLEVGQTITAGNYNFNWSISNSGNVLANSGVITDTTDGVTLLSNVPIESTNTASVAIPSDIQKTVFNATHSWNIVGENTQGGNISPASTTSRWLWKRYIGNDTNSTIPAGTIQGLSVNNALSSSLSGSYVFPGGGFKYLCIPVDFPEPNSIVSGGFPVAMADGSTANSAAYTNTGSGPYKFDLVNVTNQFGQSVDYRVYRSLNQLNGDSTFIVS